MKRIVDDSFSEKMKRRISDYFSEEIGKDAVKAFKDS